MKKVIWVLMCVMCFVSCKDGIEYRDTEVNVKYDVVNGNDTLHLKTTTIINEASVYRPNVYVVDNGTTMIIRGVNSDGNTSGYNYDVDYRKRRRCARYIYPGCNIIVKEVKMKCLRVYQTSHWSGDEINGQ